MVSVNHSILCLIANYSIACAVLGTFLLGYIESNNIARYYN